MGGRRVEDGGSSRLLPLREALVKKDLAGISTWRYILSTLGEVDSQNLDTDIPVTEIASARALNAGFRLNSEGSEFFEALYSTEGINPQARLVAIEDGAGRILRMKILAEDLQKSRLHVLDITPAFSEKEKAFVYDRATERLENYFRTGEFPYIDFESTLIRTLIHDYPSQKDLALRERLWSQYGFGGFDMLTINGTDIFSPSNSWSTDFQEVLCRGNEFFRDAHVGEIGVGTGVNLLYAARFGARSLEGTDISPVYTFLTKWNLRYAVDTGQIPKLPEDAVKITLDNGFTSMSSCDLYLFNAPSIRSMAGIIKNKGGSKLENEATLMHEDEFVSLFEELKGRLGGLATKAIWRLQIPDDSTISAFPTEAEVVLRGGCISPVSRAIAVKELRAEYFLDQQGVKWNRIISPDPSDYRSPDIFLIAV